MFLIRPQDEVQITTLRKELAMATLKLRRGVWYARVLWSENKVKKEKQVPLRTKSKMTARERLTMVNKLESDIKAGMRFTFPWLSEDCVTSVKRFTLREAVHLWLNSRQSEGIRQKTRIRNGYSLESFMSVVGYNKPLTSVNTIIIDTYRDACINRGMAPHGINLNLRAVKTFLRWCYRRDYINKVPYIDMVSIPKSMPLYIPDHLFKKLMQLEWLDDFYKIAFTFYRDTGCRASEPFIGKLDGHWLLISGDKTKQRSDKELHLDSGNLQLCVKMRNHLDAYVGTIDSLVQRLSKTFLKAMREIDGVNTKYYLHCLRHTFAVRRYLQTQDIYLVKQEMGHSTVITTEIYAKFSLRRLEKDFPSLMDDQTTKSGHAFGGHKGIIIDGRAVAF